MRSMTRTSRSGTARTDGFRSGASSWGRFGAGEESKQDLEPCSEPIARGNDDGVSTVAFAQEDHAALQRGQTRTELVPEGQGRAERRSRLSD